MAGDSKSKASSPRTPGGRTTAVLVPQGSLLGQPDVPLDRPVTTVGSNENARLHLVSRTVSKGHALFVNSNGGTYVADMASRTGVLVNGKVVKDAELRTGDRVQIGKFVFRFRSPPNQGPVPAQPESPAASVIVVGWPAYPVKTRTVIIGRRETSDIAISTDSGVSAAHSVLFQMDGKWYIRDLGSRTGTIINGKPIHQQELNFGDRIMVGSATILFQPGSAIGADPEDSGAGSFASATEIEEDLQPSEPIPVEDEITPADDLVATDNNTWNSSAPNESFEITDDTDQIPLSDETPSAHESPIIEQFDATGSDGIASDESIADETSPDQTPLAEASPFTEPEPATEADDADVLDDFALPLDDEPTVETEAVSTENASTEPLEAAADQADESGGFDFKESASTAIPANETLAESTHDETAELSEPAGIENEVGAFDFADESAENPLAEMPGATAEEPAVEVPSIEPAGAEIEVTEPATESIGGVVSQDQPGATTEASIFADLASPPQNETIELPSAAPKAPDESEALITESGSESAELPPAASDQISGPAKSPVIEPPAATGTAAEVISEPVGMDTPSTGSASIAPVPAVEHLLADVEDFVFVPADEKAPAVPEVIFWGDDELDSLSEIAVAPAAPAPVPAAEQHVGAAEHPSTHEALREAAPQPESTAEPVSEVEGRNSDSAEAEAVEFDQPVQQVEAGPDISDAVEETAVSEEIAGVSESTEIAEPVGDAEASSPFPVEPTQTSAETSDSFSATPQQTDVDPVEDEYISPISSELEAAFLAAESSSDETAFAESSDQVQPAETEPETLPLTETQSTPSTISEAIEPSANDDAAAIDLFGTVNASLDGSVDLEPSGSVEAVELEAIAAEKETPTSLADEPISGNLVADVPPADQEEPEWTADAASSDSAPQSSTESPAIEPVANDLDPIDLSDFDLEEAGTAPVSNEPAGDDAGFEALAEESVPESESLADDEAVGFETPAGSGDVELPDSADAESVAGAPVAEISPEPPANAPPEFDFDEFLESPSDAAIEPAGTIEESAPVTDFAGVTNTNLDAVMDLPPEESTTVSESVESAVTAMPTDAVPVEQTPVELPIESNESDLDFLDFGDEEPVATDAVTAPVTESDISEIPATPIDKTTAHATTAAQSAAPTPPAAAAAAPATPSTSEPAVSTPTDARRGPSLFGFDFEGGSFLGGMPISLAEKHAAPVVPTTPPPPPAGDISPTFDARATPPSGLNAMMSAPPEVKQAPPAPKRSAPQVANRVIGQSLTGLVSDKQTPAGQPFIPPVQKAAGQQTPPRRNLTGAPKGKQTPPRNVDVFSQQSAPIGVEVFGGKPASAAAFAVPETDKTAKSPLAAQPAVEDDADSIITAPAQVEPNKKSRRSHVPLLLALMVFIPLSAFGFSRYFVKESTTVAGRLAFAGTSAQQPMDLHDFIENQKKLVYSDDVRSRAQLILQKQNLPEGITHSPEEYAQNVQSQDLNWVDNSFELTLSWPDETQCRAQISAVLAALAQKDQQLDQAKETARVEANTARAKVDELNATLSKMQHEHQMLAEKAADTPDAVTISDTSEDVVRLTREWNDASQLRSSSEAVLAQLKSEDPSKLQNAENDKQIKDLEDQLAPVAQQIQNIKSKGGVSAASPAGLGTDVSVAATTQPDTTIDPLLAALQRNADLINRKIKDRREELAVAAAIPADQRAVLLASRIENLSVKITGYQAKEKELKDQLDAANLKSKQNSARLDSARVAEAQKEDLYRQISDTEAQLKLASSTWQSKEAAYANCITVAGEPSLQFMSSTDLRRRIILAATALSWFVLGLLIIGELRRPKLIAGIRPAAAPLVNAPMRAIPWPQPHQLQGLKSNQRTEPALASDAEQMLGI